MSAVINKQGLRFNWHVEYINDANVWDKFVKATESLKAPYSDAPWELYSKRDFTNAKDAMEFYMVWYVSPENYYLQMYLEIYMGDELIYEENLEPNAVTRCQMRRALNRDTSERLKFFVKENEELEHTNELMSGFIKQMGHSFENMFKEYAKQK